MISTLPLSTWRLTLLTTRGAARQAYFPCWPVSFRIHRLVSKKRVEYWKLLQGLPCTTRGHIRRQCVERHEVWKKDESEQMACPGRQTESKRHQANYILLQSKRLMAYSPRNTYLCRGLFYSSSSRLCNVNEFQHVCCIVACPMFLLVTYPKFIARYFW